MDRNEELISNFYAAFQRLDAAAMISCYSDDIIFFDPAFTLLQGKQVRSMWKMLCANAKDFELQYSNIVKLDDEYYTCEWIASYTFSKTGRRVINKAKAFMRIADGKIIEHSDGFSLHKWCMQALGFSGWLLGWNRWFQHRITKGARKRLEEYMKAEL
ncbi:MAG: nuclear transport factor 2 family protein [Bacteroidetes bacterium]|nr:nuclear transport factor 2 family protein [Bacteroidota bacterium]